MTGPVHAEVRVNDHGIWLLEVAARSIGGLCGRVLTHLLGMSLEELILRQAVASLLAPLRIEAAGRRRRGVMMIPIPGPGPAPSTVSKACRCAVGTGVTGDRPLRRSSAKRCAASRRGELPGLHLRPGGDTPAAVETALRAAYAELEFTIEAGLGPGFGASAVETACHAPTPLPPLVFKTWKRCGALISDKGDTGHKLESPAY